MIQKEHTLKVSSLYFKRLMLSVKKSYRLTSPVSIPTTATDRALDGKSPVRNRLAVSAVKLVQGEGNVFNFLLDL